MKSIIEELFLSKNMDLAKADGELFQTADELIIAYNDYNKVIEYNYKHTIRTKKQSILGVNFYLNLAESCMDDELRLKALKRFI